MKKYALVLSLMAFVNLADAQCEFTSLSVSSSDTAYVNMYHPGFFLIPSGSANVCQWQVQTFDGTILHEATTQGAWADQSFSIFNHNVPITDSMAVTLAITNQTEGIVCTIMDTLYWKETEVFPGSFVGNWDMVGYYGGVEEELAVIKGTNESEPSITIFPVPAREFIQLSGNQTHYFVGLINSIGQTVISNRMLRVGEKMNIDNLPAGVYYLRYVNNSNGLFHTKRIIKE